mmetsp:Transcript_146252/g.354928  ORF Transcript_146252/g.354928 Transcript_146252/m.354928 type:complete len:416 (-) Transcript_146252:75-1322(-)
MPGATLVAGTNELPLGERLTESSYVELVFRPINLGLLTLFLCTIVFGKYLYSLRFLVADVLHAKPNKVARRKKAMERRKSRVAEREKKRSERRQAAAPGGAGGADGAAEGSAESKGTEPGEISVSLVPKKPPQARRASQFTSAELLSANIEAARNAAFVSLDSELTESDNPAMAISFTAFLAAICIVITGPRTPGSVGDEADEMFFDAVVWTTIGVVLLFIANVMNNFIMMRGFVARQSLLDQNVATGIIEAGTYLASALIIRASLTGDSSDVTFANSLWTVLLYFALGQVALFISAVLLQKLTPYDDQKEAAAGNPAAGVKFFGNLVSLGILISNPLTKSDSLITFISCLGIGMVLLTLLRFFLDKVVLPGHSVDSEIAKDQNWGIALVEAAIGIAVALVLTAMARDTPCVTLA